MIFWLYRILAGLARAVVEVWRMNPSVALGMSEAQWFGSALVVIGLRHLFRSRQELV